MHCPNIEVPPTAPSVAAFALITCIVKLPKTCTLSLRQTYTPARATSIHSPYQEPHGHRSHLVTPAGDLLVGHKTMTSVPVATRQTTRWMCACFLTSASASL